jgi:uncharacterized protein YbjT (DUF2867 family)
MKILLTGANGYIGQRLLPVLIDNGHHVVCCVRDRNRFRVEEKLLPHVTVVEADLMKANTLHHIPKDIDGAYYLVHSMAASMKEFDYFEAISAENFREYMNKTDVRHVIYLSGITNVPLLSRHLASRLRVEEILKSGMYHLTTLRAGIIIGSGSASFEIMRDLVEKLPVMVAPKWLLTRAQPIAIRDVIAFLAKSLFTWQTYGASFDIGGPDILTYKEMLLRFAELRHLKRRIITIPILTPRLSSYWLFIITSTSFRLASNLVNSMKVEVVCQPNDLGRILNIVPISFEQAIKNAFQIIEQNAVVSSWKDSLISGRIHNSLSEYIKVPKDGCYTDRKKIRISDPDAVLDRIWSIGGEQGWYYLDMLWRIRGLLDKVWGGVGIRRGRKSPDRLHSGDTLDFWRVLVADRENRRLLLFAEMKLPGEAWLEFRIEHNTLYQEATFRPKGVWGRLYWGALAPFHFLVFNGMIRKLGIKN